MIRSKLSAKAILLATGIGLSAAAFTGSQPAAAQSYTCPDGLVYDPAYGCTTLGSNDQGYWDGGYYGYPTVLRGHPDHRGFDHGFGHGMGGLGHMDGRGGRGGPCQSIRRWRFCARCRRGPCRSVRGLPRRRLPWRWLPWRWRLRRR